MTAVSARNPDLARAIHRAVEVLWVLARDLRDGPASSDDRHVRLAAQALTLSEHGRHIAGEPPRHEPPTIDARRELWPAGLLLVETSSLADSQDALEFVARYADVYRAVKRHGLAD